MSAAAWLEKAQEQLQVHERPQDLLMILPCGHVLVDQLPDCFPLEDMCGHRRSVRQLFANERLIRTLHPATDRNTEPDFFSMDDVFRQYSFHRLAEDAFAASSAHEELVRKSRDHSGEFGIHEGHAPFN